MITLLKKGNSRKILEIIVQYYIKTQDVDDVDLVKKVSLLSVKAKTLSRMTAFLKSSVINSFRLTLDCLPKKSH